MTKNEFLYAFQITKSLIFEVHYYTLGDNTYSYFATEAKLLNYYKTDYSECGQAQDRLLPKNSIVRQFWKKWDVFHLRDIPDNKYMELLFDIEMLKSTYNYVGEIRTTFAKSSNNSIPFRKIVELSKQSLRN